MPFDGQPDMTALRLIEAVIEALGPKGKRWVRGRFSTREGEHCVMGALDHCRRKLRTPKGDRATFFLRRAVNYNLPERHYELGVSNFNDLWEGRFADVHAMLLLARELALCAVEGRPEPLRRRPPLSPYLLAWRVVGSPVAKPVNVDRWARANDPTCR